MSSEGDEGGMKEFHFEESGGDVSDPNVVHRDMRRKGEGFFENFPVESHATAQIVVVNEQIIPKTFAQTDFLEKRRGGDVELFVGDETIAHHAVEPLGQGFHYRFHFSFFPPIVLVCKENVFAFGMLQRILEIGNGRFFPGPIDDFYGRILKRLDDAKRFVVGMIVGNDDLIVFGKLFDDGRQLGVYGSGTVVSGNAD